MAIKEGNFKWTLQSKHNTQQHTQHRIPLNKTFVQTTKDKIKAQLKLSGQECYVS